MPAPRGFAHTEFGRLEYSRDEERWQARGRKLVVYHWRTPVLPAAIAVSCLLLSPALASRGGAQGGWNGSVASPVKNGVNDCTLCHGTRAGSGLVTVLGAPTTYTFNEIYNLTVRVADPDQVGAGFQISVEDAVGNHVGTLMKGDDGYTQLAPGDPGWVTHTFAGVGNAVAGWAALGNAAEYHLQWKAPEADVGEIMFYLAGNAINDDHVEFGEQDTIYLHAQSATAADTCGDGKQNNGEAGIDCGGPCPDCECLADADCDDGLFCNGSESCDSFGFCQNGADVDCGDAIACTTDTCDPAMGCMNVPVDVACDDGNVCTADACNTVLGCTNDAIPNCCTADVDCDDLVFCNGTEACQADLCEPGSEPCPGQNCDEATRSCVDCQVDADCDDGNPCTDDVCAGGACIHDNNEVDCDDGDACTTSDRCVNGVCTGILVEECCTADAECDDDVFCNGAEACQADRCESGTGPCPGQPCDEATEACVDCLTDADCDDDNPCTDDVCAGGACINDNNEVECDDGDICTASDQCVNGVCAGILVEECCATDDECDDGDECTDDTCDTNACRHDPIPDCPASDDDDEPPPGDDDIPDPTGDGSEQPLPDDDSPTPPPPRRAPCGLFGMITFPALISGMIGMRSRRRRIKIVSLRRRS